MWNRIKHTQCVLKRTRSDLTLAASSADGPLGGHSAARGSSGGEGENTGLTVQRGRAEDGGWGMGEKDEGRARGTQVGRVKEKREPEFGVYCQILQRRLSPPLPPALLGPRQARGTPGDTPFHFWSPCRPALLGMQLPVLRGPTAGFPSSPPVFFSGTRSTVKTDTLLRPLALFSPGRAIKRVFAGRIYMVERMNPLLIGGNRLMAGARGHGGGGGGPSWLCAGLVARSAGRGGQDPCVGVVNTPGCGLGRSSARDTFRISTCLSKASAVMASSHRGQAGLGASRWWWRGVSSGLSSCLWCLRRHFQTRCHCPETCRSAATWF